MSDLGNVLDLERAMALAKGLRSSPPPGCRVQALWTLEDRQLHGEVLTLRCCCLGDAGVGALAEAGCEILMAYL